VFGNYQTILGNGFAALASWGVVMPPGIGISDDIGVFVAQDVRVGVWWWRGGCVVGMLIAGEKPHIHE
jgi:hypothetical protein